MSEIRMDVELAHPPERVWRALTEQKLLAQWLDLPGFAPVSEAEVTGVEGQRRLAMLWGNDDLHTRLTWEVAAAPDGATLALRQACVYGEWDDELRARLRESYGSVLNERLPAALDWLAFQDMDLSTVAPSEPVTVVLPFVPRRGPRRRRLLLASALTLALLGLVVAVAAFRPDDAQEVPAAAPPAAPASPSATPSSGTGAIGAKPTRPSRSATPSPTRASATPRAESTRPPATAVLGASYETTSSRPLGYDGRVTVTNTGTAAGRNWSVTITLRTGSISNVSGAEYEKDGDTVVFTGAPVAAASSLLITFTVNAAVDSAPTTCEINNTPCTA